MKRLKTVGVGRGGYTIIETLIVLAASSALVLTVIALISGQQGKTQFSSAVRDADSRIEDITNDFSTGFLTRSGNVSCTADSGGGRPSLSAVASQPGTNIGCVYVGRLIQLTPNVSKYSVQSLVGRQFTAGVFSAQTPDLTSAKPVLLFPTTSNSSLPDMSVTDQFGAGIEVAAAVYLDDSNNPHPAGPFGFVSNFGTTTSGSLASDKQTPQLIILTASYPSATAVADKFETGITTSDYVINRPLAICFRSVTSDQYAIIRFGTNGGGSTTTSTIISGGTTCPASLF